MGKEQLRKADQEKQQLKNVADLQKSYLDMYRAKNLALQMTIESLELKAEESFQEQKKLLKEKFDALDLRDQAMKERNAAVEAQKGLTEERDEARKEVEELKKMLLKDEEKLTTKSKNILKGVIS